MYPYMNEDAAWQRLQDMQREMENRRLMAAGRQHVTVGVLRRLTARARLLAGLAAMRPQRRRSTPIRRDDEHRSQVV